MTGDPPDAVVDLRKIPWFAVLDQTGWNELLAVTQLRLYSPGDIVFLEGTVPENLNLVHRGWCKGDKLARDGR